MSDIQKKKIKILVNKNWKKFFIKNYTIFFRGYIYSKNSEKIKEIIFTNIIKKKNFRFFNKLNGCYSIIIIKKNFCVFLCDHSRTYPIYYFESKNCFYVSDRPLNILKFEKNIEINKDITKIAEMSGYSIGNFTLLKKLHTLRAGEIVYRERNKLRVFFYTNFFETKIINKSYDEYKMQYIKVLDDIFLDIKKKIKNRKIYLNLSSGDDSKLVAAMLKRHNYKNVHCISYGLKDNWESLEAKKICKRLNFKFLFVEIRSSEVIKFFRSNSFKKYFQTVDNLEATPTLHELFVFEKLKMKIIKNSIIFNGQPADGINGSYIKENLIHSDNFNIVFKEIVKKHYSLWQNLLTKRNLEILKKYLKKDIAAYFGRSITPNYRIMQYISYQNRICKYLMKNFEVYSFFGYKWYAPYMDQRFIKFWFSIPINYHLNRKLSKEILNDLNFYGLWDFRKKRHNNLTLMENLKRNFFKLIFFFLPSNSWQQFDRKYFHYKNDNQLKTHLITENKWKQSSGFRNSISFLTKFWLEKNLR